ncbi:hypothetical protein DTO212C5_1759 [Paecilomyces variotii]|nr:hypothetical protein DTO212C5_1759 [Paecilomyces variotii]
MRFSIISVATILGAVAVTAAPAAVEERQSCLNPLLCCPDLKTPLDPTLDPILLTLGINATALEGSICLNGQAYTTNCATGPRCCTEVNLLGGLVALGC